MEEHHSHESHSHDSHSHGSHGHGIGHDIPKVDLKGVNANAIKGGFGDVLEILKFNKAKIDAVAGRSGEGITMALVYLIIGSVAAPLGMAVFGLSAFGVSVRLGIVDALIQAVISTVIACVVLYITNMVAEKLFHGKGNFAAYFRVMGYASLINVVAVLTMVPFLATVAGLWMLGINFVTLQQVHKLDSTNAVLTIIVTVVAFMVLGYLVASLGLTGAMGGGGFSYSFR